MTRRAAPSTAHRRRRRRGQRVQDHPTRSPGSSTTSRRARVGKPDPILVADDVTQAFGGLVAVAVDHLEIQRGAITALIGPNGAGKTTFFNLLTGFDKLDRARCPRRRRHLRRAASYRLANRGMVRTFQLTKALSRMSVIDNMKLGATDQIGESFWKALLPVWQGQESEVERAPTRCSTGST